MITTSETLKRFCAMVMDNNIRNQRGLQTFAQWIQSIKDHHYPYELVSGQLDDWINYYNNLPGNGYGETRMWFVDLQYIRSNFLTSLKIDRSRW